MDGNWEAVKWWYVAPGSLSRSWAAGESRLGAGKFTWDGGVQPFHGDR